MMARSPSSSNQRPDTLMQDRSPLTRRTLLQRTAGPYIGSKGEVSSNIGRVCFRIQSGANEDVPGPVAPDDPKPTCQGSPCRRAHAHLPPLKSVTPPV